ncbi:alkaline phosphatase family protein [Catenulispora sp. NF23]|uniref:Alkaline phosphatase family protein n=1 Tax=Catenulispora pinistramenti TaxID=2705254 RepID=A0ABS5KJH0_9ACTN|nr:alkaline phosphatase family protein [Catenulispora pinistramenti]MBS2533600.1 alkaline phosphatase family protein [Catenulispora pinistramenti]MBS2546479.1 alkaline phosphatase family protein [Catenulispora pinistramenti]
MSQSKKRLIHRKWVLTTAAAAVIGLVATPSAFASGYDWHHGHGGNGDSRTTTPIKHVVVLFDENVSYDHYFGTYPKAANTDGTPFTAKWSTPKANGLTPSLLTANPNQYNPQRLSPSQALTCDQNHGYTAEQKASDNGKNDQYVQSTNVATCTGMPVLYGAPGLVMDYYDGNTVTGLWNYAQNYAMSDNSYSDVFGPSTPGALNLISGQTYGATAVNSTTGQPVSASFIGNPNASGVGTLYTDADPAYDDCSDNGHASTSPLAALSGSNVGDLLNKKNVTWGWFQGGFAPTTTAAKSANGYAQCGAAHTNVGGNSSADYSAHHDPFEYFKSTANPHHLPPSKTSMIGKTDQANHQYDLSEFSTALNTGHLPAVSFLKAAEYQDGHAGYSDPLDEQNFIATEINAIQKSPDWRDTAVIVAYDDSDGWYDHQSGQVVNGSNTSLDGTPACTAAAPAKGQADRCGVGPRQPFLVISPYSKQNYISHNQISQASILQFVENNWNLGRVGNGSFDANAGSIRNMFDFSFPDIWNKIILNPKTGAIASRW